MKRLPPIRLLARQTASKSINNSCRFLENKREFLQHYTSIEDLGFDIAESNPLHLRGLEHHLVNLRNAVSRTLAAKHVFVGRSVIEEIILQVLKKCPSPDLLPGVFEFIRDYGIHKPGMVIYPVHSLGFAGFGFLAVEEARIRFLIKEAGLALSPQTNSFDRTVEFIQWAAGEFGIPHEPQVDLIEHYFKSRPTQWLISNPLLAMKIHTYSGSYYETQSKLIARLQFATSLISAIALLETAPGKNPVDVHGSTSGINNRETLDLHHYLLFENSGRRSKRRLCARCIPTNVNRPVLAEISNLGIELNPRAWKVRSSLINRAVSVLQRIEHNYFRLAVIGTRKSREARVYEKLFRSLAYFRRSFRMASDFGESVVNLAIAYETLLIDARTAEIKKQIVRRTSWALRGVRGSRPLTQSVLNLFNTRNRVVHAGQALSTYELRPAQQAFIYCLMHIAEHIGKVSRVSEHPVSDLLKNYP